MRTELKFATIDIPGGSVEQTLTDNHKFFYTWAERFRTELFPALNFGKNILPAFLIAIEPNNIKTLSSHRTKPDGIGFQYVISMNSKHCDKPEWEQLEALVHSMVHLQQDFLVAKGFLSVKSSKKQYHNSQFIKWSESLGLHVRFLGTHYAPATGRLAEILKKYNIAEPNRTLVPNDRQLENWWDQHRNSKGKSTMVKFLAQDCPRINKCNFRSARQTMNLKCNECGSNFCVQE